MKKYSMLVLFALVTMVSCTKEDNLVTTKTTTTTSSGCVGKRTTSVQCGGTTKNGTRCQNKTLSCNGYCYLHGGN